VEHGQHDRHHASLATPPQPQLKRRGEHRDHDSHVTGDDAFGQRGRARGVKAVQDVAVVDQDLHGCRVVPQQHRPVVRRATRHRVRHRADDTHRRHGTLVRECLLQHRQKRFLGHHRQDPAVGQLVGDIRGRERQIQRQRNNPDLRASEEGHDKFPPVLQLQCHAVATEQATIQ